jgi:alpha-L-fucosidase
MREYLVVIDLFACRSSRSGESEMRIVVHIMILAFFVGFGHPQSLKGGGEGYPDLLTNRDSLDKWREMRFGMFIHWGPVTLRGTEIGWSRGKEVPFAEYDALHREFNPVLFDAREWVGVAKEAGMKYIVLVTKHHDGFSLWHSSFTDYDIQATPFRRDIVAEIAAECQRQGLMFGTYYSILDWYHPDYPLLFTGNKPKPGAGNMARYIEFMKGQLTELIERYGTRILWFDGEWEEPWTHQMGMDLYAWARGLDDTLLINNRVDKGRAGMEGKSLSDRFAGDFETPEQQIGSYNTVTPWETNMTICQQWAWKPNDELKTLRECIQILVRTAGGDGNLLLNISPMLDGRIEQRQIDRLKGIGQWLHEHGETIYGTRGGPVPPQDWGVTTHKGNRVFVHVLKAGTRSIVLPGLGPVSSARLYRGALPVTFERRGEDVILTLPDLDQEFDHLVVELQLSEKNQGRGEN